FLSMKSMARLDFFGLRVRLCALFVLGEAGDRDLSQLPVARQIGLQDRLTAVDRVAGDRGDLRYDGARLRHANHGRAAQIPRLRVDAGAASGAPETLIETEVWHRAPAVGDDRQAGARARQRVEVGAQLRVYRDDQRYLGLLLSEPDSLASVLPP